MAKLSLALSTGLLLVFFIVISEVDSAGVPKICEKASKTFSGKCANKKCDKQCISWEKAMHGSCHKREGKDACFCYYDCAKDGGAPAPPGAGTSPPPPDAGAPPGGDGTAPSPPGDGGSPPPADGGGSPPPSAH